MSEQKIKFKCAYCKHWEWKHGDFPEDWPASSYVEKGLYWPCPVCKSFMYPEGISWDTPNPFVFNYYSAFSRCPNASECAALENYQPSCEQCVLTPRCLEAVHTTLWAIQVRTERIEAALARIEAALMRKE